MCARNAALSAGLQCVCSTFGREMFSTLCFSTVLVNPSYAEDLSCHQFLLQMSLHTNFCSSLYYFNCCTLDAALHEVQTFWTHTHTHTHTQDKICTATRTHHLYEQKSQSAAGRLRPQRGQRFDLHDTGFETHEIGVGAQRVGQVDTHIYTYRVCFHISRAGCTPRSNHDLIYILETLRLKTS